MLSRRELLKGLGATIGMVGVHALCGGDTAYAAERKPVGDGKVGMKSIIGDFCTPDIAILPIGGGHYGPGGSGFYLQIDSWRTGCHPHSPGDPEIMR